MNSTKAQYITFAQYIGYNNPAIREAQASVVFVQPDAEREKPKAGWVKVDLEGRLK